MLRLCVYITSSAHEELGRNLESYAIPRRSPSLLPPGSIASRCLGIGPAILPHFGKGRPDTREPRKSSPQAPTSYRVEKGQFRKQWSFRIALSVLLIVIVLLLDSRSSTFIVIQSIDGWREQTSPSSALLLAIHLPALRSPKQLVACLKTEQKWRIEPWRSTVWQEMTVEHTYVRGKIFWDKQQTQRYSWYFLACNSKSVLLKRWLLQLVRAFICRF